jgi:N-acetylglucosamine malate deacetylase 1
MLRLTAAVDRDIFWQLAEVAHRQYVHQRVVEGFPRESSCAELFTIARRVEFADQIVVD